MLVWAVVNSISPFAISAKMPSRCDSVRSETQSVNGYYIRGPCDNRRPDTQRGVDNRPDHLMHPNFLAGRNTVQQHSARRPPRAAEQQAPPPWFDPGDQHCPSSKVILGSKRPLSPTQWNVHQTQPDRRRLLRKCGLLRISTAIQRARRAHTPASDTTWCSRTSRSRVDVPAASQCD